jgi:hypothetical protein
MFRSMMNCFIALLLWSVIWVGPEHHGEPCAPARDGQDRLGGHRTRFLTRQRELLTQRRGPEDV